MQINYKKEKILYIKHKSYKSTYTVTV